MLEIFGKEYYIDIDAITEKCQINVKENVERDDEQEGTAIIEINVFKYDIVKMCIDRIFAEFNEDIDEDDKLLKKGEDKVSLSFGIAFNTLIKYDIMKENYE